MTAKTKIAALIIIVSALTGIIACKARQVSRAKDHDLDKRLGRDRLGLDQEAVLFIPGVGYQSLAGQDRIMIDQRVAIHEQSPLWSDEKQAIRLIQNTQNDEFSIQEFMATMTFQGGFSLTWDIPARAIFAAPMPVKNFLIGLESGLYTRKNDSAMPAVIDANDPQAPQPIVTPPRNTFGFVEVPIPHSTDSASYIDYGMLGSVLAIPPVVPEAATDQKNPVALQNPKGLPLPAGVERKPLMLVMNPTGPVFNALDLTYGSLFLTVKDEQVDGSSFGIWFGRTVPAAEVRSRRLEIVVIGTLKDAAAQEASLSRLKQESLAKTLLLETTQMKTGAVVPAFQNKKMVVGGFDEDLRIALPETPEILVTKTSFVPKNDVCRMITKELDTSSSASACKRLDLKVEPIATTEVSQIKAPPTKDPWVFVQYGGGYKWTFKVWYRNTPSGKLVTNLIVYRAQTEGDTKEYVYALFNQNTLSRTYRMTPFFDGSGTVKEVNYMSKTMMSHIKFSMWVGSKGNQCQVEYVLESLFLAPINISKVGACP